jgi:hypothetical protein
LFIRLSYSFYDNNDLAQTTVCPALLRARGGAAAAALGMAHLWGKLWDPQDMIWNHPPICQINTVFKLNRDHFRIDLDHHSFQPIANAFAVAVMIAVHIYVIAYLVGLLTVWSGSKM